ncbi:MAG: phosphatase PAP2 family protein [Arcobacteraceae bacterium]|nr:phosphatase PAP2 family protein [Arcobacteraceae bacterium]
MMQQHLNKHLLITFIVLVGAIVFFGLSQIDLVVQDILFDFDAKQWILNRDLQPYKFLFYDGIKKFLIFSVLLLILFSVVFYKTRLIQEYRKGILVVVLSSILVPVVIGGLKKYTNMPCPKNEIHYGGIYPKTNVWKKFPTTFHTNKKIKCWPAGHASGGFALLSLFFLFKSRKNKILAAVFASTVGVSMGTYKMLIGDHFLSHTVLTMIIAWFVILLIVAIVEKFIKKDKKGLDEQ